MKLMDSSISSVLAKNDDQLGFSNKILSRQSTTGSSSRIYYRDSEGVPFQWEEQPGKPINPPRDDVLPPLSPPPAVISSGFPRPYTFDRDQPSKAPIIKPYSRVWIWNKIKSLTRHKKRDYYNSNIDTSLVEEERMKRVDGRILFDRRISCQLGASARKYREISGGGGGSVRGALWDFIIGGSERKGSNYAPNHEDRSQGSSSLSTSSFSPSCNNNNNNNHHNNSNTTTYHHHADHYRSSLNSSSSRNIYNKKLEEDGAPFTCNPSTFMVRLVR